VNYNGDPNIITDHQILQKGQGCSNRPAEKKNCANFISLIFLANKQIAPIKTQDYRNHKTNLIPTTVAQNYPLR
jgi:hypothetical protein